MPNVTLNMCETILHGFIFSEKLTRRTSSPRLCVETVFVAVDMVSTVHVAATRVASAHGRV